MCVQHKEANLWHVIYSTMTNLSSVAPPEEGYSLTLPPTTRVYHHCRLFTNLYLPPVHFLLSLTTPACLHTCPHALLSYVLFCSSSLRHIFISQCIISTHHLHVCAIPLPYLFSTLTCLYTQSLSLFCPSVSRHSF